MALRAVLHTKIISPSQEMWLVYPGANRRYFKEFQESGVAFLEIPGFAPSARVFESDAEIRRHYRLALSVLRHVRDGAEPPSRAASAYPDAKPSGRGAATFNQRVGNISRLYRQAKPGDVVISPAFGHYDAMLIGEIQGEWARGDTMAIAKLGNERVPVRRVTWTSKQIAMRDLPSAVAKSMRNKHAVTKVAPAHRRAIYDRLYDSYLLGGSAKLEIAAPAHESKDPLATLEAASMLKYFLAAASAWEGGDSAFEVFCTRDVRAVIESSVDLGFVSRFEQSFASPGKYVLVLSGGGLLAGLVAIGIAAATSDYSAEQLVEMQVDENDDLNLITQRMMNGIGADKLGEIQESYGRPAKEKLGLASPVEITK